MNNIDTVIFINNILVTFRQRGPSYRIAALQKLELTYFCGIPSPTTDENDGKNSST